MNSQLALGFRIDGGLAFVRRPLACRRPNYAGSEPGGDVPVVGLGWRRRASAAVPAKRPCVAGAGFRAFGESAHQEVVALRVVLDLCSRRRFGAMRVSPR